MALDFTGQAIDNTLLSRLDAPIGTYRESDLTLEQFLEETPGTWVLANGAECVGSAYQEKTGKTNVPDVRGAFKRMKDYGRGLNDDLNLGTYQADAFQGHYHRIIQAASSSGHGSPTGSGGTVYRNSDVRDAVSDGVNGTPRTDNETRPKNITVNVFFKIGY